MNVIYFIILLKLTRQLGIYVNLLNANHKTDNFDN